METQTLNIYTCYSECIFYQRYKSFGGYVATYTTARNARIN
jgi:hypothetical protein